MSIDFTLAPEHAEIRDRVRDFIQNRVMPEMKDFDDEEKNNASAKAESARNSRVIGGEE